MKHFFVLLVFFNLLSCNKKIATERTAYFPKQIEKMPTPGNKENIWVFIMAGQSNMAGRGLVEPQDTISNKRILTIDKSGQLIIAKEPLHFYEPERTGLDCGLSFAKTLLKKIPDTITILMIPTAVGGSSVRQWLADSLYRNVKLFSNFKAKAELAKQYGTIKGILWHQGESDANEKDIPMHEQRITELFSKFRAVAGNIDLPVFIGELGSFSVNKTNFSLLNETLRNYSATDKNSFLISTEDLKDKGDSLHFDSKGQRLMGKRFANAYLKTL